MDSAKTRIIILGLAIIGLGIVLGTALWLKLGPHPRSGAAQGSGDERMKLYGSVPDFKLTERSGQEASLAQLRGKVWIADFIYTSCTDTCPLQTDLMAKLQREYADRSDVQLVSISVDPERDTPAVLSAYAEKHQADAKRWFFLTGQRNQIIGLIRDGFHLSVATLPGSSEESGMIPHSPRFVLVDKSAQIRGYYDSRELGAMLRLKNDLENLLKG